jgi:valine dehydrogenase (NAD+)
VVEALTAQVVCGAANNQLATPEVADLLLARDITYAPDFVVNSGGVIQVADELLGFSFERARERTMRIFDTTVAVLSQADADGVAPSVAAERLVDRLLADAPAGPWLPPR